MHPGFHLETATDLWVSCSGQPCRLGSGRRGSGAASGTALHSSAVISVVVTGICITRTHGCYRLVLDHGVCHHSMDRARYSAQSLLRVPRAPGPPLTNWVERPVSVTLPDSQSSCGTGSLLSRSPSTACSHLCRTDSGNRQVSPSNTRPCCGHSLWTHGAEPLSKPPEAGGGNKPPNFSKGHVVLESGDKFYGTIRSTHLFLTGPSL